MAINVANKAFPSKPKMWVFSCTLTEMDHAIQEWFIFAKHDIVGWFLLNRFSWRMNSGLPHFEEKKNSALFVKNLHGQKGSITGLKQL